MFPARFAPVLYGLLLSGMQSCIISGIATLRALGLPHDFAMKWLGAWLPSWAVAFPAVLVIAPFTRLLVGLLTRPRP